MIFSSIASSAWQLGRADDVVAASYPTRDAPAHVGVAQPIVYTALGDSIATGIWSSAGYVDRFAEQLRAEVDPDVQLTNLAVNGWTSTDLLAALRGNETYRAAVLDSDVVTLSIGGNDLLQARGRYMQGACGGPDNGECLGAATDRLLANYDAILDEIQALVGPRPAAIRTMDIYNPYPSVDAARIDLFKPYLDQINSYLCGSAAVRGIACARVYAAFNGPDGIEDPVPRGLITFDGIHPSDLGHALITDLLSELAYSPLR
jgi:lysophospholipase L1-like esterase